MPATTGHPDTIGSEPSDRTRSDKTFVLADRWSWTDAAVAVVGVALALGGLAALLGVGLGPGAWLVAVWLLIVTAVALAPPRRGRVERVVETH